MVSNATVTSSRKSLPYGATSDNIVAKLSGTWQLRCPRGSYGVYVPVTGSTSRCFSRKSHSAAADGTDIREGVTAALKVVDPICRYP